MKKFLTFMTILILTAGTVFAGSPFEDDHKTSDPYIADTTGGFDSLFINPAGIADQTEVFVIALESGFFCEPGDIQKIQDYYALYRSIDDNKGNPLDSGDASTAYDFLKNDLTEEQYNDMVAGTAIDPTQPGGVDQGALTEGDVAGLNGTDLETMAGNWQDMSEAELAQLYDIDIELAAELRAGTLIKGFGVGMYARQSLPFNAGAAGFNNMIGEAGIIAGYGFNILNDQLALGVSGNFGILTTHNDVTVFEMSDFWNQDMTYGYAWGIDAGVIWSPIDSLHVGLVLNDIVGSTVDDAGTTTWAALMSDHKSAANDVHFTYAFTLDADMGVTWEPEWRVVSPKFSFDYYNVIGLARYLNENSDNMEARDITREVLSHARLGANVQFLGMLDVGFQYYNNFYSFGTGIDIMFFQVYAEFVVDDEWMFGQADATQIGANLLIKFHF